MITLVIIGVIAAITLPTLITKYQKEQTVTKLEKAYSSIQQAMNRAINDYGPTRTWELGAVDNADDAKIFFNTYLVPYLQTIDKAKTYDESNFVQAYYLSGAEYQNLNRYARFYLNDGTSVSARISSSSDTAKSLLILIDINGDKKPNIQGKDVFQFYLTPLSSNDFFNGKFYPTGYQRDRDDIISGTHGCNRTKSGAWCSALIIKDSWQIKDDYPW